MTLTNNKIKKLSEQADVLFKQGKMEEGMEIVYSLLTDDIDAILEPTPDGPDLNEKLFILDMILKFYSNPDREMYERCSVLQDIRKKLVFAEHQSNKC